MTMTRRRFMVAAAALAVAGGMRPARWEWRGAALGGEARIVLEGPRDRAEAALAAVVDEIGRLENVFSLHRPGSELSRLNAEGALEAPSRDLREVLAAASHWKRATEGAFDVAVQPLWRHWAERPAEPVEPALAAVRGARIGLAPGRVTLAPGTALTLNGIAQGTIADRVAGLLARHGFLPPVIDTGEMRLMGRERRTVDLPAAGLRLSLAEAAVATSAPAALTLGPAGRHHHLFDPVTGASPLWWRSVTVIAPTAEAADALSTGFAVLPPAIVGDVAAGMADVAVIATAADGTVRRFGGREAGA
jgi:thiamine biosynthesis lipoprotein